MFGLTWGATRSDVKARFAGLEVQSEMDQAVTWPMEVLSARLFQEDAFLPTAMSAEPGSEGGKGHEAVFSFVHDRLVAIYLSFGYAFEMIGQNPDTLSDQAMAAFARAEAALLIHEMNARYGLPGLTSEHAMRQGTMQIVLAAHYTLDDGTAVNLMFGHDAGALSGALRYLSPAEQMRGV